MLQAWRITAFARRAQIKRDSLEEEVPADGSPTFGEAGDTFGEDSRLIGGEDE